MNRRVVAVLVAVLLAIGGAALVINYAKNADARAVADNQPTKVYVAKQTIPAGTTLKDAQRKDLIAETNVAAVAVPVGALKDIGPDNNSLLALSDVQAGEFLMAARFGTTPIGEKAIEVPPGMLAVSVQLSDPARVGTFVTPGSHLTIFDTFDAAKTADSSGSDNKASGSAAAGQATLVLLPDVQVIGMGDAALAAPKPQNGDQTQQQAGFLVTLAVTPTDAARLIHGIQTGQLYAGLRGADVKIDANTVKVTDKSIFQVALP